MISAADHGSPLRFMWVIVGSLINACSGMKLFRPICFRRQSSGSHTDGSNCKGQKNILINVINAMESFMNWDFCFHEAGSIYESFWSQGEKTS